jgi:ketosteroid isomerase-like protein
MPRPRPAATLAVMGTAPELSTDHRPGAATAARDLGRQFAAAYAARDAAVLRALFSEEVSFRGLTPGRDWQADTAVELIDGVLLGCWLEPSDVVDRVEAVETAMVGTRGRLGYRLRGVNPDGRFVVEQQAFFDVADGKITWLRMLCSGFQPDTERRP